MHERSPTLSLLAILGFLLLGTMPQGQGEWTPIEDPDALIQLLSGAEVEGSLPGGGKVVARYNADGTGILEAWGDRFPRTWSLDGRSLVRIVSGNQVDLYRIDRSSSDPGLYRIRNVISGESMVVAIRDRDGGKGASVSPGADSPQEPARSQVQGSPQAQGGGAASPTAEEIAAELANPNAPLASLTFKFQFRTFEGNLPGAHDENAFNILFQPSFPFSLDNGDTVFFRPAIPIQVSQPVFDPAGGGGFDSEFGLGDIAFDLAYGRTTKSGLLYAGGLISSLPTATDDSLGTDRLTLGPEFLLGKLSKSYVVGLFPNHQWDIGGSGDVDVNLTTIQAFGTYLPGGGWNLGTAPIMTFDHEADQWTLPLNFTFGKTIIWRGRPWKISMEMNYFLEQADAFGPEWLVGVNVAPVVENVFASWFQ